MTCYEKIYDNDKFIRTAMVSSFSSTDQMYEIDETVYKGKSSSPKYCLDYMLYLLRLTNNLTTFYSIPYMNL